ncbi:MAG: glycoside hydrolase family 3 N-terminal domain-containing protein [Actinomycetota bacterium]
MTDIPVDLLRRQALRILMPGVAGTVLPDWFAALLRDGLGAVCLYGDNVDDPAQVAALTASISAANPQAIISMDEEGGDVSRLHQHTGSPFPGNAVLGRLDDVATTCAVGHQVGAQLAGVGIHLALAPDADVNSNPDNPVIGVRSFGSDQAAVARHTAAWIDGIQSAGVAACAKHFPGHGDTSVDSHLAEPVVTADARTLAARELLPFRAAIAAESRTIMTSHIRVPALDPNRVATFSPSILHGLLREKLGFGGAIVTDALDMAGASRELGVPGAAVAAVLAGADLLCLGPDTPESEIHSVIEALLGAVDAERLPLSRLADAGNRCAELAAWVHRHGADPPVPQVDPTKDVVVTPRRIAATFSLSEHARSLLADRKRHVRWVKIDPQPNAAIGTTPFGPFYDGGAVATLDVPVGDRATADTYVDEPGALTVIVGRELHRDEGAASAARSIVARSDAIVVDMGFADEDSVDIATFGASRLVGQALIELVEGGR